MVKTVLEKLDYIDVFFFVLEEPMNVRFEDIINMESSAKRMMQVNYLSAVYLTHALLPKMRERKGKIVILSSIDSGMVPAVLFLHVVFYCKPIS